MNGSACRQRAAGGQALLLVLGALCLMGSARAAELKACIADYQSEPISSPGTESPVQRIVAIAARRQGDTVQFLVAPWARCIAGMATAQYDLILGAEADQDLQQSIAFPEKGGRPDPSRRIGSVEYVLVRRSSAHADRAASRAREWVIVPTSGYAAARRLSMGGALTKSMNYDAGRFVSLLCRERTDMVVLRRGDLASAAAECEPQRTVVLQSSSILVAEVYLGVRRSLLQSRPEFAEGIWREVERLRSSPEWASELASTEHAK